MPLGENIKRAREKAGLSRQEFGAKIGKGFSTVQKYELNIVKPPVKTLEKISVILSVPAGELMGSERIDEDMYGKETSDETYINLAENIQRFHGDKARMNRAFDTMTSTGQKKAADNVEDLAKIPEFQKK